MYSVKNLIKVMSYFATAVIFITAVSLFAMQDDDGRAYAADAVASISVTPLQSVLDISDRRTVYRYDDSTGKYRRISYYDVYDYDKIKLTVDYGGYSRSYTGSEITALTATLGAPLVISDGQSESVWGNGRHTVTYTLGTKSAKAVFTVAATRIKSLSVTPMYTINAICNVKGDYRVVADESGNISQRFEYDLAGYDYNVKIIYTDGTTVRCTAADLKQITGYEPKFSQGDKVLSVGANVGYCTVGGVTAKFSFNVIKNPVKSVSLYMTGGADSLTAGNDGYYAKKSDGSTYFRFIYNETKIRAKVVYTNGSTADYPIGELCAKLHGRLEISDTQSARPWAAGTVTLPAKINGISTSLVLKIGGILPVDKLSCAQRTSNTVTLSWGVNNFATGYIIERYSDGKWIKIADIASNTTVSCKTGSLSAGTAYRFRIKAYNSSSVSSYTYTSVETLPVNVGNFRCTARTTSSITLSWNRNTTATGYKLEQYKGGKWVQVAQINSNSATSYKIMGLTAATAYSFRIRAYKTSGNATAHSGYTNLSTLTSPTSVSNVVCAARSYNSITLSWSRNTTATGYKLEQYKGGKWVQVAQINSNSATSYKIMGLTAATAYSFRIRAYKTSGNATAHSGYTNLNTLTSPTNVSNVVCAARSYNSITLSWNRNTTATGYKLEQYKGGKWVQVAQINSNSATSYKITGLTAATTYSFRTRAYKTSGNATAHSGYTNLSTLTSPTSVSNVVCAARSYNSITLSWSRNTTATGYKLEQYKGGKWVQVAQINSNSATSYKVTGLTAATTYSFRIRAYKTSGNATAHSGYTNLSTLTSPTSVSNVVCAARSYNSITLSWSRNTTATGYKLEQYKGGKWVQVAQINSNSATSYKVTGLTAATTYSFRIRAYKTSGNATAHSGYTNLSTLTSPTNVSNVVCTARSYNSITLSWNRNTTATGYKLEQYKGGKWVQVAQINSNSATSYKVTGLTAATTYSFRIRAYKTSGNATAHSGYTNLSTLTSPTNVSNVVCAARSYNSITLSWNRNTTATGYKLEQYKGGKWVQVAQINSNSATSYKITGLTAATTYSFRIRAYKTSGNATAHSGYTKYNTLTSPTNVSSFKASKRTSSTVTLGWSKNSTATGYKLEQYKGGKWVQVAAVSGNKNVRCTVSKLSRNTAYRFRIRAYKVINGKNPTADILISM